MWSVGQRAAFESIPTAHGESFVVREFAVERFNAPWHFHPELEISLILEGSGQRFVGDHIGDFAPGDLVMIGGGLPHFWHNEMSCRAARCRLIQFDAGLFGKSLLAASEMRAVAGLLARAPRGVSFSQTVAGPASEVMFQILRSRGAARLGGLLSLLEILSGCDDYELLSSPEFEPRLDTLAGERINRCHDYVFRNLAEGVDLRGAAAAAGMQSNAFSRTFRRVTGKTFSRFVNEVRVAQACRLLIGGDQQVTEICFACGFGNLSNFNRRFREIKNCSPRQFRAKYQ